MTRKLLKTTEKAVFSFPMQEEMLQALPDAVFLFDDAGELVFANEAAHALMQEGKAEFLASALRELCAGAEREKVFFDIEVCGLAVSSLSVIPMQAGAGMCVIRPLETLRAADDIVSKARSTLKPAQHMARVMAHEIKNPVAGIRAAAQILARSTLSADDHELVALIGTESARILRLVEKVNIFDDDAQDHKPVSLHEAIEEAVRACGAFIPAGKLKKRYDPSLPDILGDHDRLVQVFFNLLKNAAEAGAEAVALRSYYQAFPAYHPETGSKLPLCIDIEDNGKGIEDSDINRLFEPYYTTKPQGEGLGLAIVSKIVDDHRGMISVKSTPGKTVFTLSFPSGGIG